MNPTADDLPATAALPDAVRAYMQQMARYHVLSAAEEQALAHTIQHGDDPAAVFAARQALINHNLRLVISVAKRYHAPDGMDMGDLIGYGSAGLMRAAERFDPARCTKFSTHATWWIRQALSRALADYGAAIRKPVHAASKHQHIRQVRARLADELDREPTEVELAQAVGLSLGWLRVIEGAYAPVASLEAPMRTPHSVENPHALADFLTAEESAMERHERRVDQRMALDAIIARAHLTQREGAVIALRFGLASDGIRRTLDECGQRLRVTREYARQIEVKALTKLRIAARRTGIPASDVVDVA